MSGNTMKNIKLQIAFYTATLSSLVATAASASGASS